MRRLVFIALLITVTAATGARAKGPTSATVCGADGCRELEGLEPSPALTMPVFRAQARPDEPPTESSGWFELTMHFGDFPERFALLRDPDYIRAVGKREGIIAPGERDGEYGWLRLSRIEAEAHERLTAGLEPRPISELPDLRATAPDLAAAVRAVEAGDEGGGMGLRWLPLGAGLGLLVSAGAFFLARRRGRLPRERVS